MAELAIQRYPARCGHNAALGRLSGHVPIENVNVADGVATMDVHNSTNLARMQRLLGDEFKVGRDETS